MNATAAVEAPQPKRRGRPPGSKNRTPEEKAALEVAKVQAAAPPPVKRGPGRPPKAKPATPAPKAPKPKAPKAPKGKAKAEATGGRIHWDNATRAQRKAMDLSVLDRRTIPMDFRPKPVSGQCGPPMDLAYANFNPHEKALFDAMNGEGSGRRVAWHNFELAAETGLTKLNVRNALRRLVRGSWVESTQPGPGGKFKRGWYWITDSARARLKKAG